MAAAMADRSKRAKLAIALEEHYYAPELARTLGGPEGRVPTSNTQHVSSLRAIGARVHEPSSRLLV